MSVFDDVEYKRLAVIEIGYECYRVHNQTDIDWNNPKQRVRQVCNECLAKMRALEKGGE